MNIRTFRSDLLLFITALIWGFAFVAQRVGMESVGPFTFTGIRFCLGCLVLAPVILLRKGRGDEETQSKGQDSKYPSDSSSLTPTFFPTKGDLAPEGRGERARQDETTRLKGTSSLKRGGMLRTGIIAGTLLFAGASLQQVGLVYTTAGNAGFITGLYVVLVPIIGIALGQHTSTYTWIGAGCAAAGMYFLSVTQGLTISFGDLLELLGAFFWAVHVLVIGLYAPRLDAFRLAFIQYASCAILSLLVAALYETVTLPSLEQALLPILYGGVISVGIAYTLQIVGQKEAPSSHAAILMSLESVFAALGGWLMLNEQLSARQLAGCMLMLTGMLLSQLSRTRNPS